MSMVFPQELKLKFKNHVTSRCGLYFKDYDLKDLESALAKRMAACRTESPGDYYQLLTASDRREEEFRELLNLLTVNHTYFFRNEPQFTALKEKILPEIIKRETSNVTPQGGGEKPERETRDGKSETLNGRNVFRSGTPLGPEVLRSVKGEAQDMQAENGSRGETLVGRDECQKKVSDRDTVPDGRPSLRIWSAGCSTGEEPYSVAMVVREVIPDPENWDIKIVATDVSTGTLEKARAGVYGKNSIRSVSPEHLEKYFSVQKGQGGAQEFLLSDTIKRMVDFEYLNLIEDENPGCFDIIFCRNVTIYFELETTIQVLNKFHSSLRDDGYLLIGYSESLQFVSDRFRMEDWSDAIYYRKGGREISARPDSPIPLHDRAEKVLEEISRAEVTAEEKVEPESRVFAPKKKDLRDIRVEIVKNIHLKQYSRALSLIEEALAIDGNQEDLHYFAAEIYSNQGYFKEAKTRLEKIIGKNSFFAPAHYLLGAICAEENRGEEAKRNLKKALYLDKEFILANFALAGVYKNEGFSQESIREYRNTLRVLGRHAVTDIIAYSGGFNAATLASVCRDNIERLKFT